MDELLQLILQFMVQVEQNIDSLDDDESEQIASFLQEVMGFIQQGEDSQANKNDINFTTQGHIPSGAELLWILSNGNENIFVNYLRTYPGEGFKELFNDPNRLASVIGQLQKFDPHQEPGVGPEGIPNTQFPSSNVAGMKYDPKSGRLLVKFHGEHVEPIYQYEGVPPQIFKLLEHGNAFATTKGKNRWGEWWKMKSPSIGASINAYLKKGGYSYTRLR